MNGLKVGTARAKPGAWTTGMLTLGEYPDGPIETAVNIVCGSRPGKVLWVQSAIHGSECGGTLGALRLFNRIDPKRMKGAIVHVAAANPTAFRVLQRNTPYDGENMNRLFDPVSFSNHSRQSAAVLWENAMRCADAMMDLHSGGIETVVPFYAIYWEDGSPASRAAERLAKAAGSRHIWRSTDAWISAAMYAAFTRKGKPGVLVECGSGGDLNSRDVENFATAIGGVAKALGILPGRPPVQRRYEVFDGCELVYNKRGGWFQPAVAPGVMVRKGQVLGRMMNAHGKIVEEIRSPNGPAYVAAIVRENRAIHTGTMVAETIGRV